MDYKEFFSDLGFSFNDDLKLLPNINERNLQLFEKIKTSFYYYKCPNNTNTSFYLLTNEISAEDFKELRKYIWNKNDADIIMYFHTDCSELDLFYAKYSPSIENTDAKLELKFDARDQKKIEKIKRWNFDSGMFWLNYQKFIKKSKLKSIDRDLVDTLNILKNKLNKELESLIKDSEKLEETVQALLDRTLYIKYLEDNHIINSYFYDHYFQNKDLTYKDLLVNNSGHKINNLYCIIHEIFNNKLFDEPHIKKEYLSEGVCKLIADSFGSNMETGQLRLFDFQFEILPVEFISYIYEIFLSDKQKKNGIYYTPKKLTQLIVDDVINKDRIGTVLDPSCGSGMFLITAYQRLLEIAQEKGFEPFDNINKIKFRMQLIRDNIFGIEKQKIAQRFTLFSLSLQIFKDIPPNEIKAFISSELEKNSEIKIFKEYDFYNNIICANSLNTDENHIPFKDKTFDYIVGNPPFFEILNTDEYKIELEFLKNYKIKTQNDKEISADKIVGKNQISQAFILKLKDWSSANTRFGFVQNSSNFENDLSKEFQEFVFRNYNIEKYYELSRVKKILFEKAKEPVVSLIFSNEVKDDNIIYYYPVHKRLFAKKPFELLIIQEDKVIEIRQKDLKEDKLNLREFLVGNEYDCKLLYKIESNDVFENYLVKLEGAKDKINNGIQLVGKEQLLNEYNLTEIEYSLLDRKKRKTLSNEFKNKYIRNNKEPNNNVPFLKVSNISNFSIKGIYSFIGDISAIHRQRNPIIFNGEKILVNRTGPKLKAIYCNEFMFFDFDIYSLVIIEEHYYYLFTALLNSYLVNYFVDVSFRKRIDGSYTKITYNAIKNIPIPKELDEDLVEQISDISKDLTEGKYQYSEKEEELNELIYDLYDLNYLERQRVKDYFITDKEKGTLSRQIKNYLSVLKDTIEIFFSEKIDITEAKESDLMVVQISFNEENDISPQKVAKYTLDRIFQENPQAGILSSQEIIIGKNCVFIIKENIIKNWTETKAYEDGQYILKCTAYEK